MALRKVSCPICGRTMELGSKSTAWCSQYPNPNAPVGQGYGRKHETKEMQDAKV